MLLVVTLKGVIPQVNENRRISKHRDLIVSYLDRSSILEPLDPEK